MNNILIDLNVILDWLFNRKGHEYATHIIGICASKHLKGCVCAHEITTLSYFLERNVKDRNKIIKTIHSILNIFEVIEINKDLLYKAIHSTIPDFEDAVIVEAAIQYHVDCIITRNIKDFKNSTIKVLLPDDYIASLSIHREHQDDKVD